MVLNRVIIELLALGSELQYLDILLFQALFLCGLFYFEIYSIHEHRSSCMKGNKIHQCGLQV